MKKVSQVPCIVCGTIPTDRAHVKSSGSGGTWDDFNIVQLCRHHHRLQHSYGWIKFIDNHKHIMSILTSKGWSIETVVGKKMLVREK